MKTLFSASHSLSRCDSLETLFLESRCDSLTDIHPKLSNLYCSYCTSLTEIPILPNLTILNCKRCTILTVIPIICVNNLIYCSYCTSLTEITNIYDKNLTHLYCNNCPFLNHPSNIYYNTNLLKLIKLQKWRKVNYTKRMVKVYLKSKEFNEWFYSPNGIGGKQHKKEMENWLKNI